MDSFSLQDVNITSASIPSGLLTNEAGKHRPDRTYLHNHVCFSVNTGSDGIEILHTSQVTFQTSPTCFSLLSSQ